MSSSAGIDPGLKRTFTDVSLFWLNMVVALVPEIAVRKTDPT